MIGRLSILTLLAATPALAQSSAPGDLVPIEQGVSDRNSLGTSLRVMPVDLGAGNSFSRLYGVAGRPDLLVRSQGGVYAVFEQSDYVRVQRQNSSQVYATWPAGTVFHIGRPDFDRMRVVGIRHGPTAAMLFAPGLQPKVKRKSSSPPDNGLGRHAGAHPVDASVPDTRIQPVEIRTPGDARVRGGLPGYGRPSPRPAPSGTTPVDRATDRDTTPASPSQPPA